MIRKLFFFLPTQLFLISIKRNQIILVLWLLLFGFVTESIFTKYGFHNLFLAPEYLNRVSFWSYFINGIALGGFVMAFNITGYVINGAKFPFIASLKYPFLRYCINNSIIPLVFILTYCYKVFVFLKFRELYPASDILIFILGFISGYFAFVSFSLTYFFSTNKNIFKILGIEAETKHERKNVNSFLFNDQSWLQLLRSKKKWHVEYYLFNPFKIKIARDISHYDFKMLESVLRQNKINATIFEIVVLISFLSLGFFEKFTIFIIPASASVILFFTTILILISAFHTWLKGWARFALIALFIVINFLSQFQTFNYKNKAFGLDYSNEKAKYNYESIVEFASNEEQFNNDVNHHLQILNTKKEDETKPKLIFINTSGGGSRAALWTFYTLQYLDSILNNDISKNTQLITGSSGGMIGAAYYRKLYLENLDSNLKHPIQSNIYRDKISQDLLNPIAFYMATNDFFIRAKKFNYNNQYYLKDRGYAFEQQLINNTDSVLSGKLFDYENDETNGRVPMMIFSPSILNDGRRLLISSQPISFLTNIHHKNAVNLSTLPESVEFSRLFSKQNHKDIRFTSVLRMNATFPYIMPSVTLPTEPEINVLDAGMRDNFGALTTLRYLYTFKEWINQNTSGVVILTMRDKPKKNNIDATPLTSIIESFSSPIGSLYGNLFNVQDYALDEMYLYLDNNFDQPIDVIDFELENHKNNISLSWHLTSKEKGNILNSMHSENNQNSLKKLTKLLNN